MNQIKSISGLFNSEAKTTSASTMDTVDTSDGEESKEEEEVAVDEAATSNDLPESPEIKADETFENDTHAAKDNDQIDEPLPMISKEEIVSEKAVVEEEIIEISEDAQVVEDEKPLPLAEVESLSATTEENVAPIDHPSDGALPASSSVPADQLDPPPTKELKEDEQPESASSVPLVSPIGVATVSSTTALTATKTFTAQHRIPSRAAIKVIKGEIHNVLTVLRDQRYVSRSRFTQEIVQDDEDLNSTSHPVVQALLDLHTQVTAAAELVATQPDLVIDVDYLEPFCQCIEWPEISAIVTGKALGSLHKFVLYGFVSPSLASISYQKNREPLGAVMRIAEALLNCTFEETATGVLATNHPIDADGSESNSASNHHPGLRPVGNRSLAHLRRRKTAGKDD